MVDLAHEALVKQVGDSAGCELCDIGCGFGVLAAHFARQGAQVIGVDISEKMLAEARQRYPHVTFVKDDAQSLERFSDNRFDIVISNLALMDIPDLQATYHAVQRVLKPGGRFVFTITHPAFQSPHSYLLSEDAEFKGRHISHYASEGYWKSTNADGLRGKVGAHHRTIATYLNSLLQINFTLTYIDEPTLPADDTHETAYQQSFSIIPPVMLIEARLNDA